jgi:hypothetical protein
MRKLAMIELLLAAAIFSGCAALTSLGGGTTSSSSGAAGAAETAATAVAPGPSLFNFVARSTKFEYISPSALLADSSNVQESLIKEQCMFHTADPPFLVPDYSQKWMFVGHMNQGSSINALEYRTILTLGLTGPQQLNAWPVSLVSLSDFSDDYLAERLPVVGKAQPDVRSDVLAEYISNSRRIRGITDTLIQKYNPIIECSNNH